MSQIACKYHYDLPARWSCHSCHINYCTNCIKPHPPEQKPHCVVCGESLVLVGAENVLAPFWQRLHHFFMYPLNPVPIGIIVLLTVLVAALGNTLFGILAIFLSVLFFMKYSYVVLEDTSQGYMLPRPFATNMITEDLELPFKHMLNIFILVALNYLVYNYSINAGYENIFYITVSLTILFLPASIMVLAVKHSFLSAFNPALLFHVVKNIGSAYFLLYLFVFMMLSSASAVMFYTNKAIPEGFGLTLNAFTGMYFLLCIFNMLGYVLYQYHERIGFGIGVEVSSSQSEEESDFKFKLRMPAMVDIEILVQEGEYKKARAMLENLITAQPSDMHARGYYQKLLHLLGDTAGARKHCAEFVGRLMAEKKLTQAMKVLTACHKEDPEATLEKPTQRLEMAYLLINNGQHRLAMHLLNNLHKDHPTYSEIPEAYLLVAKMMSDQFNQDEKAIKILHFVLDNYNQNKGIDEVKEYLAILESVTRSKSVNS